MGFRSGLTPGHDVNVVLHQEMGAYTSHIEDGRYHAGTQHDRRLTPGKVTQLGPGFHPFDGQGSGYRQ